MVRAPIPQHPSRRHLRTRPRQSAPGHQRAPFHTGMDQVAGPAVLVEGFKPWIAMAVTCSHAH